MANLSDEDIMLFGKLSEEQPLSFTLQDLMSLLSEWASFIMRLEVDSEGKIPQASLDVASNAARMIDRWRQP